MISEITKTLAKRAVEHAMDSTSNPDPSGPTRQFYSWAWVVFFLEAIALIPVFVLINYTFEKVLPVFAIVEDESPPAYEPVSLDDESSPTSGSVPGVPAGHVPKPASAAVPTRPLNLDDNHPVTNSFMATWRLLRSHGGFRSIFRGFACYFFMSIIQIWITLLLANFVAIFATLAASLLLVQFSTAWVHIVMTPPTAQHFWRRLPPFKFTLAATWRPVTLLWALSTATGGIVWLLMIILGLNRDLSNKFEMPRDSDGWKYLIVYLVTVLLRIFVLIPAYVTLVRVQASLLPDDQETIIPFDRSFQGRVEPAVIGGTGYVSLRDAWETFSKAAWRRLIILYIKIMAIGMALGFVLGAIFVPQFFLLSHKVKSDEQ